jgi:hypothetical protein
MSHMTCQDHVPRYLPCSWDYLSSLKIDRLQLTLLCVLSFHKMGISIQPFLVLLRLVLCLLVCCFWISHSTSESKSFHFILLCLFLCSLYFYTFLFCFIFLELRLHLSFSFPKACLVEVSVVVGCGLLQFTPSLWNNLWKYSL